MLLLALLVVPLLEVVVIVAVGRTIGGWQTFVVLLLESALGAWLVRREGARAWGALTEALTTGRMPAGELADAALVLVGGTLLLAPGFLTDVVGFAFVVPLTRPLARGILTRVAARRLLQATGSALWPGSRPSGSRSSGSPSSGQGGQPAGRRGPVVQGTVVDEPRSPQDPQGPRDGDTGRTGA